MVAQLSGSKVVKRDDLRALVETRLAEAGVLRTNGFCLGAVYLAGYAVECQLKLAICHTLGWDELRGTFKTHNLELLMLHSGFDSNLQAEPEVVRSFATIREIWTLESDSLRYRNPQSIDEGTADLFIECIYHPEKGLLPWLQRMISPAQ